MKMQTQTQRGDGCVLGALLPPAGEPLRPPGAGRAGRTLLRGEVGPCWHLALDLRPPDSERWISVALVAQSVVLTPVALPVLTAGLRYGSDPDEVPPHTCPWVVKVAPIRSPEQRVYETGCGLVTLATMPWRLLGPAAAHRLSASPTSQHTARTCAHLHMYTHAHTCELILQLHRRMFHSLVDVWGSSAPLC